MYIMLGTEKYNDRIFMTIITLMVFSWVLQTSREGTIQSFRRRKGKEKDFIVLQHSWQEKEEREREREITSHLGFQNSEITPIIINYILILVSSFLEFPWWMHACIYFTYACMHECSVVSVMSEPRLLCPWGSPGKNIGMVYHSFLQGIFLTQGLNPHLLHFLNGRRILYH